LNEWAEVLVTDVLVLQELVESIAVADRPQSASKENPVESRQNASHAALMSLQETLHVAPPGDGSAQRHHPKADMERHSFFGCGRQADRLGEPLESWRNFCTQDRNR
jgi:hypothetical protein